MLADGVLLALPLMAFLPNPAISLLGRLSRQLVKFILTSGHFSNLIFQPITWMVIGSCMADGFARGNDTTDRAVFTTTKPSSLTSATRIPSGLDL